MLIPFLGLVGDANTKCFDTSLPLPPGSGGEVGSTCIMGSNCLYSECVNGVCVAPALTCPSNVAGNTNDILFLLLPYCPCCLIIMLYPAYLRELFFAHAIYFYRFREQKTSFHYCFFRLRDGHFACLHFNCQTLLYLTARIGTVCSKKGVCRYTDPSGNILLTCTILNTTCTASCYCDAGYGGKDCSLNPSSLAARDKIRYQNDGLSFFLVTSVNNIDLSIVIQTGVVLK